MNLSLLRPAPFALAMALALGHLQADAQDSHAPLGPPMALHIAAQPLAQALNDWARQTRVELIVPPALVAGKTAPAVSGTLTPRQALERLLAGSGLMAAQRGGAVVVVALPPAGAAHTLAPVVVTAEVDRSGATEGTGAYTSRASSSATRMNLSQRETPQSISVVTRQQMDDHNLVTLSDVLRQTPGIVADTLDERVMFSSRGFALNTMVDGVPTFSFKTPAAEAGMVNTAVYDRVEVVRGAAGLLNGVGEPGGSVNLVRKRPTSEFSGHVNAGLGRWSSYNAELDLGGPLNQAGSLRGRVVLARTAGDSFIQYKQRSDDVFYGIVEADIAPQTTLSVGYERQKTAIDGANFGQAPLFFSDGTRTDFARSFNPGTPWSQWDMFSNKLFVTLDHRLAHGWQIQLDASRLKNERKATWGYLFEYLPVDRVTGDATIEIRDNPATSTNKSLDVLAQGPFQAFGREHRAALGLSHNDYTSALRLNSANPAGWDRRPLNFYALRDFPRPTVFHTFYNTYLDAKETALYGSVRLKVAEPLALVLGARTTWYEERSSSYYGPGDSWTVNPTTKESGVFTPYAGLVLDLGDSVSAYASFTRIFLPNAYRDASNAVLPPQTGQNYEIGLKGEHLDGRLNTSVAVFRTQEKNVAVEDLGGQPLPDGSLPYRSVKGARSKGYEFTVSGQLVRGLQLMGGYTYFAKRDDAGALLLSNYPQRLLRVATSYRLPGDWSRLTVGGSLSYQSRIAYEEVDGLGRATQGGIALWGLMARYEFTRQLAGSVHIENLTDKHYYSGLGGYNGYNQGTPRNLWLKLGYRF